jgi:RimJ/RimL family protein N-acetyltransferase
MFRRWLRRRLARDDDSASPEEEEPRERGDLVRKGRLVALRTHVPANREPFQRWYADPEIAGLLRHDLEPLTASQSRNYFDTFILPASARGICFAIHERRTKRLIGTTALTDRVRDRHGASMLFRIVIGEKELWGQGYGTEATRLVAEEAFESLDLDAIRLEVFSHNARALAAYERVGFVVTGEHTEWVARRRTELRVIEMRLERDAFYAAEPVAAGARERSRDREAAREERAARRAQRQAERAARRARAGRGERRGERGRRQPGRAREPDPD